MNSADFCSFEKDVVSENDVVTGSYYMRCAPVLYGRCRNMLLSHFVEIPTQSRVNHVTCGKETPEYITEY